MSTTEQAESGRKQHAATVSRAKIRQRRKRRWLLAALMLIVLALALGWWPLALLLALLCYLANEVLFADHVFYDPAADYCYQFAGASITPVVEGQQLHIAPQAEAPTTIMLQVGISANGVGRLLDPWVEVCAGSHCRRQYFERAVGGVRYLNLSAFCQTLARGEALQIRSRHCTVQLQQAKVLAFKSESVSTKPTLIIAPHADDAEIAAFGLYSQAADCTIVTVTAGETDAEQFIPWLSAREEVQEAARFKGQVRCLNALSAAIWGGVEQQRCIALGYGCMQLAPMREQPAVAVSSPYSGLADTRPYRQMNRVALPSDKEGETSWQNLLADLSAVVQACRPEVIVAAHPLLDKHPDHVNATRALWQVLQRDPQLRPQWLLYVNHLEASQDYPFGPAHSEVGLPPRLDESLAVDAIYSVALDRASQRRKALALDLMHDLKRPVRAKKWLRKRLQYLVLRRALNPYGEDDFFRKAVRSSEVFLVAGPESMAAMMDSLPP